MSKTTRFFFEDKLYEVDSKKMDDLPLELPDGRVLEVTSWELSRPLGVGDHKILTRKPAATAKAKAV
jgi:hypothetical protein